MPTDVRQKTSQPDADTAYHEAVRHIPLSSRQRLCINPSVARLGSLAAINDRCNELQQSKSKTRCGYIPKEANLAEQHAFRDAALATLPDIEDLHGLGKEHHICPYYASRGAVPGAEIITLPYPLLLQRSAREALGVKLEGNVVIIDEAHNIMDAIAGVHAAEISLGDMRRARVMLGVYVKRFGKKLKGENRVLMAHVGKVVESLTHWMEAAVQSKAEQGIVEGNILLAARGADQINLFRLIRYIQESKLAFKVESYASHAEEEDKTSSSTPRSSSPVLHSLVAFLEALTNLGNEGRIFFERTAASVTAPSDVKLKYLLLSPTNAFSSIASEARAIILAGGTMSPFDDYKAHLFPNYTPDRITTLSCGHVIPASNLCVWTLATSKPSSGGTSTDTFEFSFQKRSDVSMIRQLGLALLNICGVVPDGVVVFFPSYGYLDEIMRVWQTADPGKLGEPVLWDRLAARKAVFCETRGGSSDDVLAEYSAAVLGHNDGTQIGIGRSSSSQRGALLLSVVGGKMSEGINFSDQLGRCIVIVGLPYPNINSPEWKARIEYLESSTMSRLLPSIAPGEAASVSPPDAMKAVTRDHALQIAKQASRDFYENACMRAVNQSIGRAIRHKGDYAAIVLVDRRFGTQRIRGKLPGWIRGGMVDGSESKGVSGMMGALNGFFRGRMRI
jgi:chromosome transmission fidelity protein 1